MFGVCNDLLSGYQVDCRDLLRIDQEDGPLKHSRAEHLKGLSKKLLCQPPQKVGARLGV